MLLFLEMFPLRQLVSYVLESWDRGTSKVNLILSDTEIEVIWKDPWVNENETSKFLL